MYHQTKCINNDNQPRAATFHSMAAIISQSVFDRNSILLKNIR